jgi:hypothetical protein
MPTYYKLTECAPGIDIIYTDTDLTSYIPGNILSVGGNCYDFEEVPAPLAPVVTIIVNYQYATCNECTRKCYMLLSCDPASYPNLYLQSNSLLEPYLDQLININNDFTKKYKVVHSLQYIGITPDNAYTLCGISETALPINYQISSFILNGIEYVVNPYSYSTTDLNFQPLACTGLSCVPANCSSGPLNNYTNFTDMLNGFFNSLSLPIQAYPYNDVFTNKTQVAISYQEGNTFSLTVDYTGFSGGTYFSNTAGFVVDSLGNAIRTFGGYPMINYLPYIACVSPTTVFTAITPAECCYPCYEIDRSECSLTTEYIERVNCTFASQVYNQMIITRYGVTVCCDNDLDQWDIKKQVLDFELAADKICKKPCLPCTPFCPVEPI